MNKKDLQQVGDLIDEKLEANLKPIQETLDSHSRTLVALENETMPMIKEIYENTVSAARRVSTLGDRVDTLEPRVDALEAAISE